MVRRLLGGDRPSGDRLQAECSEEVSQNGCALDRLGRPLARQGKVPAGRGGIGLEDLAAIAPVADIGNRIGDHEAGRSPGLDDDLSLGMDEREGAQQKRVDHTEDRDVGRESQGDRHEGQGREGRPATERTGGETNVGE